MRLVRAREAAEALGTTTWRVYDLVRRGVLPPGVAVRVGRAVRIDADALAAWVAAGGAGLADARPRGRVAQ